MVLLMAWHYLRVVVLSSIESVCAGVGMLVDDVVSFSLYRSVSLTLPPLCS